MIHRGPENRSAAPSDLDCLRSEASSWLLALALEVEAGRLSLDQARASMERRRLRIVGEPR